MTKEKQITVKLDVRSAAAVRQVLFESQKGYSYNEEVTPPRVVDIRKVILQLDEKIGEIIGE